MDERPITDWLPLTKKEVEKRGWDELDVILVSGDAYVDHPAFGTAVIGRIMESEGLKVGIVAQPNWQDDLRDFKKLGKPKYFFGVTAGCMDSMVNHYTANKRLRSNDSYTPGGEAGFRPDYATTVYTKILKDIYPDNYYGANQYGEGQMSGIYDLETEGRSVINKLNTNYTCFCILLTDINKVMKHEGSPEIKIVGLSPLEQINETKRFVSKLDEYKSRIFTPHSGTFQNLMATLGITHDMGGKTEDYAVILLKKKFGNENVEQIGELGHKEDMIGGVDCKVTIDSKKYRTDKTV